MKMWGPSHKPSRHICMSAWVETASYTGEWFPSGAMPVRSTGSKSFAERKSVRDFPARVCRDYAFLSCKAPLWFARMVRVLAMLPSPPCRFYYIMISLVFISRSQYNRSMVNIGNSWDKVLQGEFDKDYYLKLREFLKSEYGTRVIIS